MGEQGVDQGAFLVAGGGMHDQPGGLVQHDEMAVLEQDGEGDGLRLGDGADRVGRGDGIGGAGADRVGGLGEQRAVTRGVAGFDQGLDAAAGERADGFGEEAVGALAGGFGGRDDDMGFWHWRR